MIKSRPMKRLLFLAVLFALGLSACQKSLGETSALLAEKSPLGTILFQDDFARTDSGWDHLLVTEGVMDYYSGGYRILVNAAQTNFWATPRRNFTNARIEVETGKMAGPDENRIGLLCRYSNDSYYFFIMTSDGFYGIGIYQNGEARLLGQSALAESTSINQGLAINHLRADCVGDTLTFYINGVQVAQTQDAALSSGDVGILAGAFDQLGADILFDDFIVLQP